MRRCFLLFSICSISVFYSQQKEITLQQAIDIGLNNNRSVKKSKYDLDIASKQILEKTALGLPQISANIGYNNNIKQRVSIIPASAIKGDKAKPGEFEQVIFGQKQDMSAFLNVSQLLLDGSYFVALKSAKVYKKIKELSILKTKQQVKSLIITSYANALVADENVSILEKNLETAQQMLKEQQALFENGFTEEENVQQSQINVNNLENSMQNAIRMRELAYNVLSFSMGEDVKQSLKLITEIKQIIQDNIDLKLTSDAFHIHNNIDYQLLDKDRLTKRQLLNLERMGLLPKLTASMQAGYNGYGDNFNFTDRSQLWIGSAVVGINLDIPIFTSFKTRAKIKQAKLELLKSELDIIESEQQLTIDHTKAKNEYTNALDTYYTSVKNMEIAQKIEYKNQIKFKEGLVTSLELQQSQNQLYDVQNQYLFSIQEIVSKKETLENILNKKNTSFHE